MTDNDVKQVTLTLNTAQAEQKLGAITQRLEEARQKKTQAFEQGNAKAYTLYAQEAKKLEQQQQRLISRTQTVTRTLQSLDKATPRDLRTAITQINRQLNSGNIERGSKEWNTLTRAMAEAKAELQKINEEQRAAEKSVADSAASWGEKWSGFVVTIQGVKSAIDTVITSISKYVDEYAQMQEHTSSVTKYTGLAKEEVDALNESFQRMDTATPRAKLNDLAADAGRLGIQSRQSVQEFVEAADQINTALGDDLGEDAVKNIGKLAQLFGDSDRMGLKQAMLSTGSVINELAQSSSASEGYLMEFTARLAGVGKQASLTQAQVMAFGSVLDQNMVGVEKGATALQNVIVALFAKPEKMAKAAKLNVQEFTNLLKTDANAAILQFIQALNDTGGFDRLAPLLKEMNLSGSGVTQTLSALANNLDNLKQTQQQATQAFREGTSCTNEAAFANSTVAKQLEKAQQRWADLRIELGEKLTPIYITTTNALLTLAQSLRTIINFIVENRRAVITITAAIATYTTATIAATVAQKAWAVIVTATNSLMGILRIAVLACQVQWYTYTGATIAAAAAQSALNTAVQSNGFTAFISLILAAIAAIGTYFLTTNTATDSTKQLARAEDQATAAQRRRAQAQKALQDAQAQAAAKTADEKARIQTLTSIIHDNTASIDARRQAITSLQSIIPDYHANISKTGTLLNENSQAITDYIANLDKLALAEAIFEKIKANTEKQLDIDRALEVWNNAVNYRNNQMNLPGHESQLRNIGRRSGIGTDAYVETNGTRRRDEQIQRNNRARLAFWQSQDEANKAEKKWLDKKIKDESLTGLIAQLAAKGGTTTPTLESPTATGKSGKHGKSGGGDNTKEEVERKKKINQAIALLDEKQRQEEAQAAADYQLGNIKSYNQYQQKLIDIDNDYIALKRDLYRQGDTELDTLAKQQRDNNTRDTRLLQDTSLAAIDAQTNAQIRALKERYYQGQLAEEDYQDNLDQIQETRLQRRLQWLRDPANAADPAAINAAQEALDQNRDQQRLTRLERLFQKAKAFREQYAKQSIDQQEKDELTLLDRLTEAFKWSEEEKLKYKKQIQEKYEKKRKEEKEGKTDDTDDPDREKRKIKDPLSGGTSDEMANTAAHLGQAIDSLILKLKDGQATWKDFAEAAVSAFALVAAASSSATQLIQANQQLEEARVTKRYDAEIKAAGSNTKRGKKLEEQKQKELAQIKTKYNKKQMKIELAQAVATTAMNALKAYGAMADIPVVGPALGAIAAAAAIAAGAIQIASIKKQHAAEQEGYYSGGYTGGHNYRQSAGIVHQGEFVANHQAVRNPAIRPVLDLIDTAQRTNRIATLTPADVSRAILAPQATAAATSATAAAATQTAAATTQAAATAPHTTQIITTTTQAQTDTLRRLADQLDQGIRATVTIDGPDGLDRQYRKYQRLNNI